MIFGRTVITSVHLKKISRIVVIVEPVKYTLNSPESTGFSILQIVGCHIGNRKIVII